MSTLNLHVNGQRLVIRRCLCLHMSDHADPSCLHRSRHRGIWLPSKSNPGQNLNADFLAVAVNDLSLVVLGPRGIDVVGVVIEEIAVSTSSSLQQDRVGGDRDAGVGEI